MYHNISEIETAISNFATSHPSIAERIPLPEASFEGRSISCLRLGSQTATSTDGALFIFGQHARELVPPEIALALAADLVSGYANNHGLVYGGKTYSAAQVKLILDTINIFLVPCVNPDGRLYAQNTDPDWRKNRKDTIHATCIGVDLNRNYDFAFDLAKYFDITNPSVTNYTSDDPCNSNQVYHGPSAFSESETRNIRWLLDTYSRIRWFMDIHGYTTQGQIYHPWGDDENQSDDPAMNWRNPAFDHQRGRKNDSYREYIRPQDLATHVFLANAIRDGIQPVHSRTYLVQQSFGLYPTSGCSDDYVWSRHLVAPFLPRVESFVIEHRGNTFNPGIAFKDEVVLEVTSGLVNFCLACAGGAAGLTVTLRPSNVVFNRCPVGRTSSRPVILQVTGSGAATFRVETGPARTGGASAISFGTAVAVASVPASPSPVTRDLYVWLTCAGGLDGDTATGTVRVACPEASWAADVPIVADFVAPLPVGGVLALDRSGSMSGNGGDGRTRLQVLLDSAPSFVDLAPPGARIGLVRFATDESPGAPMTTMGPEGDDPGGRNVIREAIALHTLASGAASYTSIGDGVFAATALLAPEAEPMVKSMVVLTDGHENRPRYIDEVTVNNRVFAIGLGTPEEIQPIALDALTNGTGGYLLMTGTMDADDPYRLTKYYLQILAGVTNDQIVLDPAGWLPLGGTESIPFYLNEADQSIDVIVLIAFPQIIRMRLRSPSGQIFDQSHPSMNLVIAKKIGYYRFTLPVPGHWSSEGPGRWELLLEWDKRGEPAWKKLKKDRKIPGISQNAMQYTALVHARSDLAMAVTVAQDRYTPGANVIVRARLTQYENVPLDGARVEAQVRFPDGSTHAIGLVPRQDGAYESGFVAPLSGVYAMRILAEGRSLRGSPFTREAARTAAVWRASPRRPDPKERCLDLLRALLESKAIDPAALKKCGVHLDRLLEHCAEEGEAPPAAEAGPRARE